MSIVSPAPRTVRFQLNVSRFWNDPDLPDGIPCLACGDFLLIHQPDVNDPDRLLGTCDGCGSWHLIDGDRAVIVLLPDADVFSRAEVAR